MLDDHRKLDNLFSKFLAMTSGVFMAPISKKVFFRGQPWDAEGWRFGLKKGWLTLGEADKQMTGR